MLDNPTHLLFATAPAATLRANFEGDVETIADRWAVDADTIDELIQIALAQPLQ